ncbi:maleylpyruvate isomerase [Streptacidiphilus sp. MAP12-16]|uniref:maleylpyruvate isomerase family mycothiol-dependent enzyme n=1 Tax=Streptacidiphilus sp. MAP12-16 TaxID=3156300 RepID=UPI00351679C8
MTAAPTPTLAAVSEATGRLLRAVGRMRPEQVFEPSALPGWTRGHVLTHLARNADALCNLLLGARTSQPIQMYPSPESRDRAIEDGAKRPLAEQLADLRASALRFVAATEAMPDSAWSVQVPHRLGPFPAARVADKRYSEVEYHHVDLLLDYSPAQWPADFVAEELAALTERYHNIGSLPPVTLFDETTDMNYVIGQAVEPDAVIECGASGPSHALVAWLSGRSQGEGLEVRVGCAASPELRSALPAIPPLG